MERREKFKKAGEASLTILTVGILAAAVALSKDKQPQEKNNIPVTSETVFKSETISMAHRIWDRIKNEKPAFEFPEDSRVKNSAVVTLETTQGRQHFIATAYMQKTRYQIDPNTVYELTIEKKFADSRENQNYFTILSPELGPDLRGPTWLGTSETASEHGQKQKEEVIAIPGETVNVDQVRQFMEESSQQLDQVLTHQTYIPSDLPLLEIENTSLPA
jgi:hypothetical protein